MEGQWVYYIIDIEIGALLFEFVSGDRLREPEQMGG